MSTPLPREEFAVTERYVYLNHAAAGVLPATTLAEVERFARAHAQGGVLGTFPYDLRMPEYRERIGRFVGASGRDVAILPNTSSGASTLALGIDWKPADEVLLCDNEFPANSVPWLALRRRGVDVRMLSTQRERLTPELLRRQISPRTRVVTVSWVSYYDGYRHDLHALAQVARDAGALFFVDAIQGLGVFPIDVRALGIDALFAGAGKWMLGLHGAAVLYVSPALGERLQLAMPGWRSVEDMWDFHNDEQPFTREALRFEGGTPNLIGTLSMNCAIELFERARPGAIAAHVLALTDRLCEGLERYGARISTIRGESCSSGIVTFAMPGCESMALGRALEGEGVITTYRPGGVRVSPHGYTSAEEIDVLLEALPRLSRTLAAV